MNFIIWSSKTVNSSPCLVTQTNTTFFTGNGGAEGFPSTEDCVKAAFLMSFSIAITGMACSETHSCPFASFWQALESLSHTSPNALPWGHHKRSDFACQGVTFSFFGALRAPFAKIRILCMKRTVSKPFVGLVFCILLHLNLSGSTKHEVFCFQSEDRHRNILYLSCLVVLNRTSEQIKGKMF